MKREFGNISIGQFTISVVMIFLLMFSFAVRVNASRPLKHHHKVSKTSFHRLKIAKAYSGPSDSGVGHAIMHDKIMTINERKKFKTSRAYSGPSRRGAGHGLSHLWRDPSSSSSSTP
ncbi:hypothetical protein TIFTF001_005048 [Ficus carica]|uniref:Transmembrane protein n=1 Tax=Ficus carica TaxID=3494 RepID=A0AA87ZJG5_FICCA|nr:hypothetical protein TIFTF001_005048 [Ficus carica]